MSWRAWILLGCWAASVPAQPADPLAAAVAAVRSAAEISGENSVEHARALRQLARSYAAAGRADDAAAANLRALGILEARGTSSPMRLATAHGEVAANYYHGGRFDEALPRAQDALRLALEAYDETDPRIASFLYLIAGIEQQLGEFETSLAHLNQALEIYRVHPAEPAAELVKVLAGLAILHSLKGQYGEAREVLARARERLAAEPTPTPPMLEALLLTGSGLLEVSLGRHRDARRDFERLLEILPKDRPKERAVTLRNLAITLIQDRDYAAARRLLGEAITLFPDAKGDPRCTLFLLDAARLAELEARPEESARLAARALTIERSRKDQNPLLLCKALVRAARAHHQLGELELALAAVEEAIALAPWETLPCRDAAYAHEVRAQVLWAANRRDDSRRAFAKSMAIARSAVAHCGAGLAETERLSLRAQYRSVVDGYLSATIDDPTCHVAIADELASWKCGVLSDLEGERSLMRARTSPEIQALQDRLTRVLDALSPRSLLATHPVAANSSIVRLLSEREDLERRLALVTKVVTKLPRTAEICTHLAPDEAIVDFLAWRRRDPGDARAPVPATERMLAVVLRRDRTPVVVDLGEAEPLRNAVRAHVALVSRWVRPEPGADRLVERVGREARRVLWDPLGAYISGARRISVIPDSYLAWLPFETLPGEAPGTLMMENIDLTYLLRSVDRVVESPARRGEGALIVGGVDFGSTPESSHPVSLPTRAFLGLPLPPLPGTLREITNLESTLRRGGWNDQHLHLLTGPLATEARFRDLVRGKSIVHLATHGIFVAESDLVPESEFGMSRYPTAFSGHLPSLLSGVALAGVNQGIEGQRDDDGILTASEVGWLDLSSCDLIMLSCCDSGRGTHRAGESLLGLRRALRLAGARTTITALWRVDDQATADLTQDFYAARTLDRLSKGQSLRRARLAMLRRNREQTGQALIGTFGGFVLEGDFE